MDQIHPYPALARLTVRGYFKGREINERLRQGLSKDPEVWSPRRGCFVTIKNNDGSLRGCIGTISPAQTDLGWEIAANAVSSATRDPRFEPMEERELENVFFSVDVLEPPEPVTSLDELDPARWGVIVSKGFQRGLLLPDLEGVDTVIQQVSIAARKAGLHSLDGVALERFTVSRYPERTKP